MKLLAEHLCTSLMMTFLVAGGMILTSPLFLVHEAELGWAVTIGWIALWLGYLQADWRAYRAWRDYYRRWGS